MSYPLNSCSHSNQSHGSHAQVTQSHSALKRKSGLSNGLPSLSHTITGFSVQRLSAFPYPIGGPRVVTEVERPRETGRTSLHPSTLTNLIALRNRRFSQTQILNPNLSINRMVNTALAQSNGKSSPNLLVVTPRPEPNTSSPNPRETEALGSQNPNHTQAVAICHDGYDGVTHSLPHRKNGPYTCPKCRKMFATSQTFAAHVIYSHYRYESSDERKRRLRAKYKRRNLHILGSGKGLTVSPNNNFSLQARQNSGLPSFVQGNPSAASMADAGYGIKKSSMVASAERAPNFINFMRINQEPAQ